MTHHKKSTVRSDGRNSLQLRPISITENIFEYASGSLLISVGSTKVLIAVTMQRGVPPFLRGKGEGWLTAEYAMLPAATVERTQREITSMRRNSRSIEISRLISRSLRSIVDLSAFADRTIMIDCDVLQADGGTRTVAITGACLALQRAQERWLADKTLAKPFLTDSIVAVSVGVLHNEPILDPNFQEDSQLQADFNVVMTTSGNLVEIQGGAEGASVSWDVFAQVQEVAKVGLEQWQAYTTNASIVPSAQQSSELPSQPLIKKSDMAQSKSSGLFSLQNRL